MCVPKEPNDQTVPLWAHLMPGKQGPSRSVPGFLGGESTRSPWALGRAIHRSPHHPPRRDPTPGSQGIRTT